MVATRCRTTHRKVKLQLLQQISKAKYYIIEQKRRKKKKGAVTDRRRSCRWFGAERNKKEVIFLGNYTITTSVTVVSSNLTHRDACKVQDFVIGGSVLFYNASINSEMKISVIRIFIRCVMRVGRNRINHSSLICFVISPMKIESMMYHLGMIEIIAHSGVSELRMKWSCRFCNHFSNSSVEILDVDNYFYRLTDSARSKI